MTYYDIEDARFNKYVELEDMLIDVLGYKTLYDNVACYFGSDKMLKALESIATDFDLNNEDEDED